MADAGRQNKYTSGQQFKKKSQTFASCSKKEAEQDEESDYEACDIYDRDTAGNN